MSCAQPEDPFPSSRIGFLSHTKDKDPRLKIEDVVSLLLKICSILDFAFLIMLLR